MQTRNKPFVVLALPRSRTAWMSRWLGGERGDVGHDIGAYCDSIAGFDNHFAPTPPSSPPPLIGTVETGAAFAWRLLRAKGYKLLIIRRRFRDVIDSLSKQGITGVEDELCFREGHLEDAVQNGILWFDYNELDDEISAAMIWHYLLEQPFDVRWWLSLRDQNIQINVKAELQKIASRAPQIMAFKAEVVECLKSL